MNSFLKTAIILSFTLTNFVTLKGLTQTIEVSQVDFENLEIEPEINVSKYKITLPFETFNLTNFSNFLYFDDKNISRFASDLQFQAQIKPEDNQEIIEETPTILEDSEDSNFDNESTESTSSQGENLAEQSQNPIANLISVPFQNNTNFGVGELDRTQNILNIQPVIPIDLNDDWLLVTRTILPIVYQPALNKTQDSHFGLGDLNPQLFFVPKTNSKITWGVGPVFLLPTATDDSLGTGKWGIGPTAVIVVTDAPWVVGALANNIWSFAGDSDRPDVSQFLVQPFINYNLPNGWYLISAPIITANWNASSGNKWTVPIGGGVGKLFNIGNQAVNASIQGYWNAKTPEGGADWTLRTQFQLLFPKGQ